MVDELPGWWDGANSLLQVVVPQLILHVSLPLSALIVEPDNTSLLVQLATGSQTKAVVPAAELVIADTLQDGLGGDNIRNLVQELITAARVYGRAKPSGAEAIWRNVCSAECTREACSYCFRSIVKHGMMKLGAVVHPMGRSTQSEQIPMVSKGYAFLVVIVLPDDYFLSWALLRNHH